MWLRELIEEYVKGVQSQVREIWDRDIEEATKEVGHLFNLTGTVVGGAALVLAYLGKAETVYPILVILSFVVGGSVGFLVSMFAYGALLYAWRLLKSAFVVFVPPVILMVVILVAWNVLVFLFTPLR